MTPIRGRVYWADIGYGEKPWLCVSNNSRNNQLDDFLAVRITTSSKPDLNSIVPLTAMDRPLVGNILCDDINPIGIDEVARDGGAVSPQTMMRVASGLRAALAI